jgi:hypothetical protein
MMTRRRRADDHVTTFTEIAPPSRPVLGIWHHSILRGAWVGSASRPSLNSARGFESILRWLCYVGPIVRSDPAAMGRPIAAARQTGE